MPTPLGGVGNITNEPLFLAPGVGFGTNHVPGDYHLALASPCIDAGTNQAWMGGALGNVRFSTRRCLTC